MIDDIWTKNIYLNESLSSQAYAEYFNQNITWPVVGKHQSFPLSPPSLCLSCEGLTSLLSSKLGNDM